MGGILSLRPEDVEKRIHPRALEHFRKFQADVRYLIPLEELTEADIDAYLEDFEKPEFQDHMNQLKYWLGTCIDIGDADSNDNQTKILLFELHTTIPMFSIKQLLGRVYDRKVKSLREEQEKREQEKRRQAAKAEEERKKKEEEEQWHATYKALSVPTTDAEKYLTEPGDYEKFIESIAGAVRAYMDKGESYTDDSRAKDYLFYCDEIKRIKDKERQKVAATESARLFSYSLNEKIKKLKASLYLQKQSPMEYFGKDSRYTGQRFYDLLSPDEREDLFDTVQAMVKEELDELLAGDLSEFTSWKHTQYYRLLPTIDYVIDDIPCLDFSFDTDIVVEAEIWLKLGQKTFGDYVFNLPVIEENNHPASLQELKFLGYYYLHFAAFKLPSTFWQRIPLLLIASLTSGEIELPGVAILEASQSTVIYRIKNFKKEVIIPAIFREFLKTAGGIDGMVSMGIATQEVGSIVQRKLTEVEAAPVKQTSESTRTGGYSDEEFVSKMARLSYSKKDSEILLQHTPRGLSLDEALKWSLEHYREVIAGNHSTGNSQPPKVSYTD
jgi:hypothetical protein